MNKRLKETVQIDEYTPWRNSYWFARMLLNGDKYGSVGKSKESQIFDLAVKLETILLQDSLTEQEKLKICRCMLAKTISALFKKTSKGYALSIDLANDINSEFKTINDIIVFVFCVKYIVIPMNTAILSVPSSDMEFCAKTAIDILDALGEEGVAKVITTWDNLGVKGCLDFERNVVVSEFTKLRNTLKSFYLLRSEYEDNIVLTAFIQEFERRLAQKRKNRAGTSLEDVLTFLFERYDFSSHPKPDHFQTDIEVDKWFRCNDGWVIGISCKRTLRERWKQVSSADSHALSRYKIKEIWHLITYDKDLSDDKLVMLGQQRQIFYLDENGERFLSASAHKGMKDYVRPLCSFIADIRKEQII